MSTKRKLGFLLDEMRDTRKSVESINSRMVCKEDFRAFQSTLHDENAERDKKIDAHEVKLEKHGWIISTIGWILRGGIVTAASFLLAIIAKHLGVPLP